MKIKYGPIYKRRQSSILFHLPIHTYFLISTTITQHQLSFNVMRTESFYVGTSEIAKAELAKNLLEILPSRKNKHCSSPTRRRPKISRIHFWAPEIAVINKVLDVHIIAPDSLVFPIQFIFIFHC